MRSLLAQLCAKKWGWPAGAAALLLAVGCLGTQSIAARQTGQANPFPDQTPPFGAPKDPNDLDARRREEKQEKGRNAERQKRLVSDTDKLLALAKELKDEVEKSNKDTLSVDVVKKASEIEKLARTVKDRMRE